MPQGLLYGPFGGAIVWVLAALVLMTVVALLALAVRFIAIGLAALLRGFR